MRPLSPAMPALPSTAERVTFALVFVACAVSVGVWIHRIGANAYVYPDVIQLMRSVRYVSTGRGYLTDIGWYEAQLNTVLPAAQTVWPPGLTLVTGAFCGLAQCPDLLAGARLVAILAHVASGTAIGAAMRSLAFSRLVSLAAIVSWLLLFPMWTGVIEARSECLFMAAAAMALACCLRFMSNRRSVWLAAAAGFLALCALTRYQAIALLPAFAVAVLFTEGPGLRRRLLDCAVLIGPPLFVTGVLQGRNLLITGSQTGAASLSDPARFRSLAEFAQSISWVPASLRLSAALALVLLASAFVVQAARLALSARGAERRPGTASNSGNARRAALIIGLGGTGTTILLYCGLGLLSTSYPLELRYVGSTCPLLAVALAAGIGSARQRSAPREQVTHAGLAEQSRPLRHDRIMHLPRARLSRVQLRVLASVVGLIAIVLLDVGSYRRLERHLANHTGVRLRHIIEQHTFQGRPLLRELRSGSLSTRVIASNRAQELAIYTPATIFGISNRKFNSRHWTPQSIEQLMHFQNADYVLLFPDTGSELDVVFERIQRGDVPAWLAVQAVDPEFVLAWMKR